MFNLLIQFLPMLVTLPLREGGQMEHATQNTQTKSHFLSTSQPPLLPLRVSRSLCPPSLSQPLLLLLCCIFLTFHHRLRSWPADGLTDSLRPTSAPVKMEKLGVQHLPDRFCNPLTLCLQVAVVFFVLFSVLFLVFL